MRTRTLAQLRDEVRNRYEIDDDFVPDSELVRMINSAYAEYYGYLVDCNRDLFLTSSTITVASGTQSYSMPTDLWKIVGVDVLDGTNYYTLEQFNFSERNKSINSGSNKYETRYRAMQSTMYLEPVPSWSGTLKVWYIPEPTELTADADTVKSYAGFEEFIILVTGIQFKHKSEEETRELGQRLAEVKNQIARLCTVNDAEPDRVRNVLSESGTAYTRYGFVPRLPGAQ